MESIKPSTKIQIKLSGRVLVVDDNWITLKMIEKMLENFSLDVVTRDSGVEALKLLEIERFDMLFLDCSMPEIDGKEVASVIRQSSSPLRDLTIIAFTSDDSIENRQMCREAGMNGLLAKPYSVDSLQELLEKHLAKL